MGSKFRFPVRLAIPFLAALALWAVAAPSALAHPLGNFTINHYSRIELGANELRVRYVLDYAEIPTFQERQAMDQNKDRSVSADEQMRYLANQLNSLEPNLHLTLNNAPIPLALVPNSAELSFPPGQGGLNTMRLGAWFSAPLGGAQTFTVAYRDDNYAERIGWREIVLRTGEGVALRKSDVPTKDTSDELRNYPQDLLSQPLNERAANFTFALGASNNSPQISAPPVSTGAFGALDRTKDQFAALIATKEDLSLSVIIFSLFAALVLGALHAFSPGHGKTIVGAYLVGSRGTAKHALFLGLVVTATHTIGVYALGLVTLFLSRYIFPEQLYPWLGVTSGVLVALIGARLFLTRLAAARVGRVHSHVAGRAHAHAGHEHEHEHPHHPAPALQAAFVLAGAASQSRAHQHPQAHEHHFENDKDQLAHARSHIPAMLEGAPLTWKNLVSLGISGGLLPCPSALVVMLSAIALGRVVFGLVLILAFSIGLAGVLIATGLVLLYAGKLAAGFIRGGRASGWFVRLVPVGSALVVALLGLVIATEAFLQTGLLK
jgi:nickel/cobalt exporter